MLWKRSLSFVIVLMFCFLWTPLYGANHQGHKSESAKDASMGHMEEYAPMPAAGKKVPIGAGYYLIYGFDKKPKMGTAIMKVEIFTSEGKKDTSFEVKADAGMPSMKGAHETGEHPFSLSKKGDYLLPINFVMPGEWEIKLSVAKTGKVVFRGACRIDV